MNIDYSNIDSIISGFDQVLSLSSLGSPPPIPSALILTGVPQRSGLSSIKIAKNIISRKVEAGLPVGLLPSGEESPDEKMEKIRIEEILKALQEECVITVVIPAGTPVTAAGISPTGPVVVNGATISLTKGFGIIQ